MKAACVICNEQVEIYDQADHLKFKHPSKSPVGGFPFWVDGQQFTADEPSMNVGDLLNQFGLSTTYAFYMEVRDELVPLSHGNSVDLTQEPHFCSIPPATY